MATTIDGTTYSAVSRSAPVAALCRELVAAGVPDGPMMVTFDCTVGTMAVRSVHRYAGYAVSEGDAPVRD